MPPSRRRSRAPSAARPASDAPGRTAVTATRSGNSRPRAPAAASRRSCLGDPDARAAGSRAGPGRHPRAGPGGPPCSQRATTSLSAPNQAMLAIRVSIGGIAAGRDRLVEIALDQAREPRVERGRLGLEHPPRAHRVEEQQPRHRPVTRERREHRVERRLGPGDGLGLERHRPLDARDELVGGRLHELAEDRFLVREVEVDPALARLRGARDVVDGGVPVAAGRERVERGVEDPLAAAATLLCRIGARHRDGGLAAATDRPVGRFTAILAPETWYCQRARCCRVRPDGTETPAAPGVSVALGW